MPLEFATRLGVCPVIAFGTPAILNQFGLDSISTLPIDRDPRCISTRQRT